MRNVAETRRQGELSRELESPNALGNLVSPLPLDSAVKELLGFLERLRPETIAGRSNREPFVSYSALQRACANAVDLGFGTFCHAFKIDFGGSPLVLKVPRPFLEGGDYYAQLSGQRAARLELAGLLRGQKGRIACLPQYFAQLRSDSGKLLGIIEEFVDGRPLAQEVHRLGRPKAEKLIDQFLDRIYDDLKRPLWDIQISNLLVRRRDGKEELVLPDAASLTKLTPLSWSKEQAKFYLMDKLDTALSAPPKSE